MRYPGMAAFLADSGEQFQSSLSMHWNLSLVDLLAASLPWLGLILFARSWWVGSKTRDATEVAAWSVFLLIPLFIGIYCMLDRLRSITEFLASSPGVTFSAWIGSVAVSIAPLPSAMASIFPASVVLVFRWYGLTKARLLQSAQEAAARKGAASSPSQPLDPPAAK